MIVNIILFMFLCTFVTCLFAMAILDVIRDHADYKRWKRRQEDQERLYQEHKDKPDWKQYVEPRSIWYGG